MHTHQLPIIDIGGYIKYKENKKQIAQQLFEACTTKGFFLIEGHGVSSLLIQNLEQLSHQFFQLPLEKKMKIKMSQGGTAWRGYFQVAEEMTSGKPDMKEGLYFGEELSSSHPLVQSKTPLHGSNLFPEEIPEMKNVVLNYFEALKKLAQSLMELIALSLNLDKKTFESIYKNNPLCLFRIFNYPHIVHPKKDIENWGVGAHTDYGMLTILWQDKNGGLEIFTENEWINVPFIEGTLICNIGDMLEKMTMGLYCSTLHRVFNKSSENRLSFPFFYDPDFLSEVKILPLQKELFSKNKFKISERWDQSDPKGFEGIYGNYIQSKIAKVFPQLFHHTLKK